MSEYKINTSFNESIIEQEVEFYDDGIRESIMRNMVMLQDEGIRNALIALGWSPPGNETKLQAENEALKARAAELESAMRSVNRSEHHAITVSGDDEPRYWQRKKWVDWIFFLGNGGSDEVRGD